MVDGRIAVEVRRLVQSHGQDKSLEQARKSLTKLVKGELARLDQSNADRTFGVSIRFRRPIHPAAAVRSSLRKALLAATNGHAEHEEELELCPDLFISIRPIRPPRGRVFVYEGMCDYDAGGFVIGEYVRAINEATAEKAGKIERVRDCYPVWWLLLVDALELFTEQDDIDQVADALGGLSRFDRVLLVGSTGQLLLSAPFVPPSKCSTSTG